jgi:5'-deoxynucleotidase YfbR-like HD superfamily hydrolase
MNTESAKMKEIELMNEIFRDVVFKDAYRFIRTTFHRVKTFESWRGRVNRSVQFFKEEKEALNAMVFVFLLIKSEVEYGVKVNWDACIAYIITRLIRKSLTWDMKPGYKRRLKNVMKDFEEQVNKYVRKKVTESVGESFYQSLYGLVNRMSEDEKKLYSVAKSYTDHVEYSFVESTVWYADRNRIKQEIDESLKDVDSYGYISKELGRLISFISSSRNSIRWQGCGITLDCSILCHMLETAVLAWFMAIENNLDEKNEKICPSQAFKVGLYHDMPELWTDDIPSICKNEIGKESDQNLRMVTEELEKEVMDKHFYPVFSEKVAKYLKANVMLEDMEDKNLRKFIKKADYFSADLECYWMILHGSGNILFYRILRKSCKSKDRTVESKKLLKEMYFKSILHIPREP